MAGGVLCEHDLWLDARKGIPKIDSQTGYHHIPLLYRQAKRVSRSSKILLGIDFVFFLSGLSCSTSDLLKVLLLHENGEYLGSIPMLPSVNAEC